MNEHHVKGAMKDAEGKVQKEFGKAVDSPKHTIEGAAKQVAGKTQKAAGDMKDGARRADRDRDGL
jgi:uncharacterized protein YjbJ (UPF0337 family)